YLGDLSAKQNRQHSSVAGSSDGRIAMEHLFGEDLIIDDRVNGIFRVNRRSFPAPAIFEIEKREVFDRSWLYAGHVSEIAKPGDFITRRIGGGAPVSVWARWCGVR